MREIYGFLRLANQFGHTSQVRTQALVLQTCADLRVRLARALNALEPHSVLKRSGEAGIVRHGFRKDTETYPA